MSAGAVIVLVVLALAAGIFIGRWWDVIVDVAYTAGVGVGRIAKGIAMAVGIITIVIVVSKVVT